MRENYKQYNLQLFHMSMSAKILYYREKEHILQKRQDFYLLKNQLLVW